MDANEPKVVGAFFGGACGCAGVVMGSTEGVVVAASEGLALSAGGYQTTSALAVMIGFMGLKSEILGKRKNVHSGCP